MHSSDILILDEPTSGLDPLIQADFFSILDEVKKRGGSAIVSNHVLNEVQNNSDTIVMIKDGKLIHTGNTQAILQQARKRICIHGNHTPIM